MPKKYIEDKGEEYFGKHPVGSGPYRVVGFTPGYSVELEAVDWEHFDLGLPRFKRVVVRYVPEESTRMAMLKTGELDGSEIGRRSVSETQAAGLKVFQGTPTLGAIVMLVEQYREDSPLHNERVRRALALAIDKESIFKTLLGGTGQVNGAILGVPRNPPPPAYPFDPGRAKQLLAEAGYPQGFSVDVYANTISAYPEGPEVMQAVARYWSQIGLKTKIIPITWNALQDRIGAGQLGVAAYAFSSNTIFTPPPTVGNAYLDHFYPKGLFRESIDPAIVQLVEKVVSQKDSKNYLRFMEEMGKYAYDHVLGIKIADVSNPVAANPSKVRSWLPFLDGNVDINIRSIIRR